MRHGPGANPPGPMDCGMEFGMGVWFAVWLAMWCAVAGYGLAVVWAWMCRMSLWCMYVDAIWDRMGAVCAYQVRVWRDRF